MGHMPTVDWDKDEPRNAVILGGRYDGHSVLYVGPNAEYKGERYVVLWDKPPGTEWMPKYLLERMASGWFSVR